ncbi:MAG TPA: phosphatidate cytidylyltransferase [Jatrophihabitans sp.]|jgi:phosphatidate cytidylyltransferase|nr:phosphatidate cytidylyltransferase [Jatrophihabitans sp.]
MARARRTGGPSPSQRPRPPSTRRHGAQPGVRFHTPPPQRAPAQPPPKSRAGRNLPAAIGVGLGLAALIVPSLFLYRPSFAVIVGVIVVYGCYEMARALASVGIRVSLVPLLAGSVAVLVATWERGPSGLVVAVLVSLVGVAVWRVADGAYGYTRDVTSSALILIYVPTLAAFAVLLVHPSDGAGRVLAFAATVVCSDTGGYATGVLFGKHPMAPIVSRAKTWEGFAGSLIACGAAGVLFAMHTFHEMWWKGLIFGVAIAVTATLGDLGESLIKRDLDIKDMGKLLPGHGGVMDRLDSLLPCAAVAYLMLSWLAPV